MFYTFAIETDQALPGRLKGRATRADSGCQGPMTAPTVEAEWCLDLHEERGPARRRIVRRGIKVYEVFRSLRPPLKSVWYLGPSWLSETSLAGLLNLLERRSVLKVQDDVSKTCRS